MGQLMVAGIPWEAAAGLTREQAAAVLDGMAGARQAAAAAAQRAGGTGG